jgi:hypothetical protein
VLVGIAEQADGWQSGDDISIVNVTKDFAFECFIERCRRGMVANHWYSEGADAGHGYTVSL